MAIYVKRLTDKDNNTIIPITNTDAVVDGNGVTVDALLASKYSSDNPPPVMTGASASVNGTSGLVPQPVAGNQDKFLRGDGTWQTVDSIIAMAYCDTAGSVSAKVAKCTGYSAQANTHLVITIVNTNTAASALTLNINNVGAKPVFINNTATSTNNYNLSAGTYFVFYNGTNYYFRTDGAIQSKGLVVDNSDYSGYVWLLEDAEGGTIRLRNAAGTYTYEIDGVGSDYIRLHNAYQRPSGIGFKQCAWYGSSGLLLNDGEIRSDVSDIQLTAGQQKTVFSFVYKNPQAQTKTVQCIRTIGDTESATNNGFVCMGSNSGTTVISAGEGPLPVANTQAITNTENLYLMADGAVHIWTGCANDGSSVNKAVSVSNTGAVNVPNYVYSNANTAYGTYMHRNSILVSSATNPSSNGFITWQYT